MFCSCLRASEHFRSDVGKTKEGSIPPLVYTIASHSDKQVSPPNFTLSSYHFIINAHYDLIAERQEAGTNFQKVPSLLFTFPPDTWPIYFFGLWKNRKKEKLVKFLCLANLYIKSIQTGCFLEGQIDVNCTLLLRTRQMCIMLPSFF